MLTTSTEEGDLFEALRSGACGYLLKTLEAGPFLSYLEGVSRGEAAISREIAGLLLQEVIRQDERRQKPAASPASDPAAPMLTPRQIEILKRVAQGLTYKEVADRLCLSEHTIKYHMGEILRRLHLKNREQVVTYALRSGLVRGAD
jgi:DNA-binding NarL/FixJ family response regulator